ncbi:MAG: universal stress protein [Deltaproteobacteria bacterium]|nr:universal stress protein [Deltaproteobacteria bacterium]MBW2072212.1 universal stress protein [Deltaproteobacteria bacterium]
MPHRVLIAVDGSDGSMKAVDYAGEMFSGRDDALLVLFCVLPATSRLLLSKEEVATVEASKDDRPDLAGVYWKPEDEKKINIHFAQATRALLAQGVDARLITAKFKVKSGDVAEAIIDEARAGRYRTLILGRRGLSRIKEFFMGSVSKKVVGEARGFAVWVVD